MSVALSLTAAEMFVSQPKDLYAHAADHTSHGSEQHQTVTEILTHSRQIHAKSAPAVKAWTP
jgi:hypothetical protein